MGFEPTRAEHNGLAVHRLHHSATSSACCCCCSCSCSSSSSSSCSRRLHLFILFDTGEKEPASSFCLLGLVRSPGSWAELWGPLGNRSQPSRQKLTEQQSPTLLPGKEHGRVTLEWLSASKGLEPDFEINLSPATFPSHSGRIRPAHTDRSHSHLTGGLFTRTEPPAWPWRLCAVPPGAHPGSHPGLLLSQHS